MSEPFLSEIRMFGFNFPPRGWAQCDGQILPINQNQSLYSLLGTTYGGDGRTSFALPDLRGRAPLHFSSSHPQGQRGGEESHTLSVAEMPAHTHAFQGNRNQATLNDPLGNVPAAKKRRAYSRYAQPDSSNTANMHVETISSVGGGQSHENMQPYRTVNFCIAIQGVFPSRN